MEIIIVIEGILILVQCVLLYKLFKYKRNMQGYFESANKYREEVAFYFFCKGMEATEEGGKNFFQVYEEFKNNSK
jgi:hypothetical protein